MAWGRREASPFEERLGYRFRHTEFLETALTHSSFANEQGLPGDYERMEFLGDAVLGLVTAHWLFDRYPDRPEGELSKYKSSLVSARSLARHAKKIRLGEVLRLGVGEERSGGRRKSSLLANSMEAIFGAVFRDGGLEAARTVVVLLLEDQAPEAQPTVYGDAKTELQEFTQAREWALPAYFLVAEEGPDHDKRFEVECRVEGEALGRGKGRSKKIAEQTAASAALSRLSNETASDLDPDNSAP